MDALFGLPRKKSAGKSHRDPLFESLYFLQQSNIDEFINKQTSEPNINVS